MHTLLTLYALPQAGLPHGHRCAQTIGGQQDDPAAPDALLQAVAIGRDRFHPGSVGHTKR
jgi:hypothetical protein